MDYTLTYTGTRGDQQAYDSDEKPTYAGKYTATVTLTTGNKNAIVLGEKTFDFTINPKAINLTWLVN
ncbi:hypothetical protein, partial [Ralstonia pseudosolanacearum]|uniref:hypothetical protein n=1 Tax=Ralstonia pseudosolanacearum TaxID=1310165 RepID=UPI003CF9D838